MATIVQFQLRKDTAANWTSADPVLAEGEPAVETDTGKMKIGDGATAWTSLAYQHSSFIGYGSALPNPASHQEGDIFLLTS